VRVRQVKDPTNTVVVTDSDGNLTADYAAGCKPQPYRPGEPHSRGCNILWLDGHVSWDLQSHIYNEPLLWDRD